MEHKFRHEDHNRQDKAKKPAYREDLIENSKLKADPAYLKKFKKWLEGSKEVLQCKEKLILKYYDGIFFTAGRNFRFRWTLKEYIQQNDLKDHFSQTYERHRKLAAEDFKTIEAAIRNAPAAWGIRKGKQELQGFFSPLIRSDQITPLIVDDDVAAKILRRSSA